MANRLAAGTVLGIVALTLLGACGDGTDGEDLLCVPERAAHGAYLVTSSSGTAYGVCDGPTMELAGDYFLLFEWDQADTGEPGITVRYECQSADRDTCESYALGLLACDDDDPRAINVAAVGPSGRCSFQYESTTMRRIGDEVRVDWWLYSDSANAAAECTVETALELGDALPCKFHRTLVGTFVTDQI